MQAVVDLSRSHIRAVAAGQGAYFVFADGSLLRTDAGSPRAYIVARLPNIAERADGTGEVRLYVHEPWVCVSERFGVNAALVNIETGSVRPLSRKGYHSDVSSYSIGFLDRDGRTLLIAQTVWNRLDIFDAETGANLTEREIWMADTGTKHERGHPVYEYRNYLDFFHSLLHVSPDSRHFLSNGWVWSPIDVVLAFSTQAFLDGWELSGARVQGSGYNWDRPCTFIDNDTFVLALDDLGVDGGMLDEDELSAYTYKQLAFFRTPKLPLPEGAPPWVEPTALVSCEAFPRNDYGEVKGELHHDPVTGHLVALTQANGAYLLTRNGQVLDHLPEISLGSVPAHTGVGRPSGPSPGWAYSPRRRVFYRWRDRLGVQEHALPAGEKSS